jgi:predicted ArsR family transcriptional regulator
MRWWEQQIGGATRGKLIGLIRRGVRTVEGLAAALHLTDNAVRAHIQTLEKAGLVRAAGTRQGTGAGKPATTYRIVAGAEPVLSSAYAPVLTALLETLAERLSPDEVDELLRESGRRLAGPELAESTKSLEARVRSAASVLRSLGAEVDVERTPTGFQLRGHGCPLSAAVKAEPHACHAVEELVAALVQAPVRECCDRSDGAQCRFTVLARTA